MNAFPTLPSTAAGHFQLRFFAAVLRLRERVPAEGFPFLADYCSELDAAGLGDRPAFLAAMRQWESGQDLPLLRLEQVTGLDQEEIEALFLLGLVDEDARFGAVFEHYTGHARPTMGLLYAWWPRSRGVLRRLAELGLVAMSSADPWRADAGVMTVPDTAVVPNVVWEAARGDPPGRLAPWMRFRSPADLVAIEDLIVAPRLAEPVAALPHLLGSGAAGALVVRGPEGAGRRTLVGAVARARDRGVLEVLDLAADDPRWRSVGVLSTLLNAVPLAVVEGAPGDSYAMPDLPGRIGDLAVVAGRRSGVHGSAVERAVCVDLTIPGPVERARHWAASLGPDAATGELAGRFRMTGGCIRRVGELALAEAALAGRADPAPADVVRAAGTLRGRLLDAYAIRVPTRDSWDDLAVDPATRQELHLLAARCRYRERLADSVGPAAANGLTAGVRSLFTGPSGTGKTLAARTLVGVLGLDLYRLDLSNVVNKYLGETEKNLERVFGYAEEADVVLLIDEGDALLTQRTAVRTSNDRYANLETNFLLQRLESFEGILVVTTNAGERIDNAFRRRMDVVIDFVPPEEAQRQAIWQSHLPARHDVPAWLLDELVERCPLSGGQIRNAVLRAGLLAMNRDRVIGPDELAAAVRREYVKAGEVCPLYWDEHVG